MLAMTDISESVQGLPDCIWVRMAEVCNRTKKLSVFAMVVVSLRFRIYGVKPTVSGIRC